MQGMQLQEKEQKVKNMEKLFKKNRWNLSINSALKAI